MDLPKTFDSKAAEERWFQRWIDLGYFTADPNRDGKVFSVVIPPPNVTGQLHLGHALNVSLQDIIVRTRRMQGYNTLWLPGTDHAGIATQNAVEKDLAKEKKNRHTMGRDAFVNRVWEWREMYGSRILNQLRRLGASCDWSRERFTLDPGLSRAVTKVFVDLYHKGLIYRAKRMINWCPRCETALSDLEVDHKDAQAHLWYIRYPLADGSGAITIATTRPETMLGDTAVAVNPNDERYTALVGKTVALPLVGREIKIIADAAIDREFGTGALKVTPGHDPVDFELGQRHGLEQISILDGRANINENGGVYRGMSREEARKQIVKDLEAAGLLEKIEPHSHSIGVCSRCDTVVEPMLSEQWFLAMREMADRAIEAVRNGDTTFHPKFWENTFFNWLENIHDWCISRQLWWGHRIPAYRCARCDHLVVAMERPQRCPECDGSDIIQDDDVLDTWFSSGLWPISTLGWPDDTPDLRRYYPTSLLLTGFDIIFFWVARMMMFGLEFTGKVPFKDVYITPLVRDELGKKMTKSKGNVVDPLDLMEQYGADAVRFTLAQLAAQGRDVILSHDRFAAARAFANKIWNAARFVKMNLDGAPEPLPKVEISQLGLAERWILSRLDSAIREVTRSIDSYEFNVAAMKLYQFIWHEFCDWYIELSKEPLKAGGECQAAARWVLVNVFDQMLRLLHPFMPFVTEEIWQVIRPYLDEANLAPHLPIAKYPEPLESNPLSDAEQIAMQHCIEATEAINSLRSLLGWHPGQRVNAVIIHSEPLTDERWEWEKYVRVLGKLESVRRYSGDKASGPLLRSVLTHLAWADVGIEVPPEFDYQRTRQKLHKELEEARKHAGQHEARLNDEGFRQKADPDTIEDVKSRFDELQSLTLRLQQQIKQLDSVQ
ncbi:MAG: valine--tRNA ligase [Candidatus Binatus sp.]|uniref:valine--tRNA ligase n=1 Tax=Candidatus Binatus sp. TaxID=2811406 RepID=UPI0027227D27|nr:valine--tRNA ligase [Candidatus Binatus sp.]MDO8433179.1 valine--tRNA ligase [Candidatus Binatus sp.]